MRSDATWRSGSSGIGGLGEPAGRPAGQRKPSKEARWRCRSRRSGDSQTVPLRASRSPLGAETQAFETRANRESARRPRRLEPARYGAIRASRGPAAAGLAAASRAGRGRAAGAAPAALLQPRSRRGGGRGRGTGSEEGAGDSGATPTSSR